MIVAGIPDPHLRRALLAVAHPEEDVVTEGGLVLNALQFGHPRLVVRASGVHLPEPPGVPVLVLDDTLLARWDFERRLDELPLARHDFFARKLAALVAPSPSDVSWVDVTLAHLGRAVGARLPLPLRCFGRRILEFPIHYKSLHALARACSVSRGALKARFRRRGLASPSSYLRWFRVIAAAHALSDRSVTVSAAAHRLGFTSAGNLCRLMSSLAGLTPTEVRTVRGWNRLLISFAWGLLTPAALEAWAELSALFRRRAA